MFIVIEGPDGVGTTTQTRLLGAALEAAGESVHLTREPSGSPIGVLTRECLRSGVLAENDAKWQSLALLFAADRLQHVAGEIDTALAEGKVVISDRYVLSSYVYQGLHVDDAFVRDVNRFARKPDLTLVISLDVEVALNRIAARKGIREVFDERALQLRVHERYESLAESAGGEFIDGSGSAEEVCERLVRRVQKARTPRA